jgi:ABC-2 type transport system permease protein
VTAVQKDGQAHRGGAGLGDDLVTAAPPREFWAGTVYSVRALWRYRELLDLLVRRELKSRYKDSSLGFIWTLIRPLTQLLIYYVAVGTFLGATRSVPNYAVFVFSGLTVWTMFNEIVQTSTASIVNNAGLVKKVYIPRELFPLAATGAALVNFAIQLGILLVAVLLTAGPPFFGPGLWAVPVAFVTLAFFSFAIGMMLSAVNVFLRDVKHLIDVGLLVLFWASPIVYSFSAVHAALKGNWLEQIYLWNPVTIAVLVFQRGLWRAGSMPFVTGTGPTKAVSHTYWPPDLYLHLVVVLVVSAALVWVAQRVFARLEGNFAQEL